MSETINSPNASIPLAAPIGDEQDLPSIISQLRPINRLPKHAMDNIVKQANLYQASVGESLQHRIVEDNLVHFLIAGSIQVFTQDNASVTINATDPDAKMALAKIAQNAIDVVACCPTTLVRIPWETLERYLIQYAPAELSSTLEVQEILSSTSSDWMVRLLQSDLFSILPATNIQEILSSIEFVDTFADEVVVEEGTSGEHFFIVDHGEYLVSKQNSKTGAEVELAVLKSDDFFGEEALITGAPRCATITSIGTGKLIRLNSAKFKEYIVAPAVPLLSADGAKSLVAQGAHMIDVREPDKFAVSAIPDSANIMLNLLRGEAPSLDKDSTYILVDDIPNTAVTAAFVLRAKGYDARCLNLPLEKYAVLQGIELNDRIEPSNAGLAPLSEADRIQPDLPARPSVEAIKETNGSITTPPLDLFESENSADIEVGAQEYISSETSSETLTGIGLAELIEELNETYDKDNDHESIAPFSLQNPNSDNSSDASEALENSALTEGSGYQVEYFDDEQQTDDASHSPETESYSEETLIALAAQREQLNAEFFRQLAAEKQACRRAIQAHRAKLANEYREKQAVLLENSKKLVTLANKVREQKADIENARAELAIRPTITSLGEGSEELDCVSKPNQNHPAEGWSSFLRTAKQ